MLIAIRAKVMEGYTLADSFGEFPKAFPRLYRSTVAAGEHAGHLDLVLNRLLDGFEGKLTNAKWAALAKTSSDTALRDINDLVDRGVLAREAEGGRSTSYSLVRRGPRQAYYSDARS